MLVAPCRHVNTPLNVWSRDRLVRCLPTHRALELGEALYRRRVTS